MFEVDPPANGLFVVVVVVANVAFSFVGSKWFQIALPFPRCSSWFCDAV